VRFNLGRKWFGSKIVNCEFTYWLGSPLAFLLHFYHLFGISLSPFCCVFNIFCHLCCFFCHLINHLFYHVFTFFVISLHLFVTLLSVVLGICQRFVIWGLEISFDLCFEDLRLGFGIWDLQPKIWDFDIGIWFGICPALLATYCICNMRCVFQPITSLTTWLATSCICMHWFTLSFA